MNYAQMTDEDVLTAYYNCDDAAWNMLEQRWRLRYLKALLIPGYLRGVSSLPHITMREVKAKDCVQDVMVKISLSKGKLKDRWNPSRGSVRTFVRMELEYVVRDLFKKLRIENPQPPLPPGGDDDGADNRRSSLEGPGQEKKDRDWPDIILRALQECVSSLPAEWQQICHMRFMEKKKLDKIAEQCKVSVSMVHGWLKKHIEPQLRACLKEKGVELPGIESEER